MLETDRLSPGLTKFISTLSDEDKDNLLHVLRDPKTFLAEDMDDVLAILQQMES
jgi:hypothetical protein